MFASSSISVHQMAIGLVLVWKGFGYTNKRSSYRYLVNSYIRVTGLIFMTSSKQNIGVLDAVCYNHFRETGKNGPFSSVMGGV